MTVFSDMSDVAILGIIGNRVKQERLNQNRTQEAIAKGAGVAVNVVRHLETGDGCTLGSFIRVLRILGKLNQLDSFLPEPGLSPLQLAKHGGRTRLEASGERGRPRGRN